MNQPIERTDKSVFEAASSEPLVEATYSRVTRRLLPFLFLCYVVAYLDRVNIGFAKLQMAGDLHFSETVYGAGAGIFFIGYFLFEVPSNIMLARFGARKWMARIMLTWGIISGMTAWVSSTHGFYIVRFLLGLAEAGLFPGVILYLTYWYPAHRRARVVALFMAAQPVSGVIGAPLSGWILQSASFKSSGMANWQWLFLIEAAPSLIMGIMMLFYLDDSVHEAKWLTESEKKLLDRAIVEESHEKSEQSVPEALLNGHVLFLALIYFCLVMGLYGVGFWMPTMLQAAGAKSSTMIGWLTAIPYGVAVISMVVFSRSADRMRERRWHLFIPALAAAIGLMLTPMFSANLYISAATLCIATAGIITSLPLFWSLPTAFLGGSGAAAGLALINSIGSLAGFVSPYLVGFIKDATGSTNIGVVVIAVAVLLGGCLVLALPPRLVNK